MHAYLGIILQCIHIRYDVCSFLVGTQVCIDAFYICMHMWCFFRDDRSGQIEGQEFVVCNETGKRFGNDFYVLKFMLHTWKYHLRNLTGVVAQGQQQYVLCCMQVVRRLQVVYKWFTKAVLGSFIMLVM
eukprot:TRINITY_DN1619_c1_g1_i1.p5 TRINITY_DN1619_c1_g1~~TRINITY_DN1619_c1_g1_i1.p5  ORF type:complete len:129 (-),score=7.82 TRINITY_DN1619_c1_g1_i1:108-494(-)